MSLLLFNEIYFSFSTFRSFISYSNLELISDYSILLNYIIPVVLFYKSVIISVYNFYLFYVSFNYYYNWVIEFYNSSIVLLNLIYSY